MNTKSDPFHGRSVAIVVDPMAATASIFTCLFVAISFFAAAPTSTYRYAFIFLAALLWTVFYVRRPVCLHPLHFALFGIGLLIHYAGAFGFYRRDFIGL